MSCIVQRIFCIITIKYLHLCWKWFYILVFNPSHQIAKEDQPDAGSLKFAVLYIQLFTVHYIRAMALVVLYTDYRKVKPSFFFCFFVFFNLQVCLNKYNNCCAKLLFLSFPFFTCSNYQVANHKLHDNNMSLTTNAYKKILGRHSSHFFATKINLIKNWNLMKNLRNALWSMHFSRFSCGVNIS